MLIWKRKSESAAERPFFLGGGAEKEMRHGSVGYAHKKWEGELRTVVRVLPDESITSIDSDLMRASHC